MLQLYRVYESNTKVYLLLEYQEGGSLYDVIKNKNFTIEEKVLQEIMAQLFLAVDFMHSKRIIHRDLKLDNILLNSKANGVYELRIADFGLAK